MAFQLPNRELGMNVEVEANDITPTAVSGDSSSSNGQTISSDEIALYDRQIRLWGVKAQQSIRTANILLFTVKALGNEIAKNLVLAGIGSLTIVDNDRVTEADLFAQFFLNEEDVGKNRAEAALPRARSLNPRVNIRTQAQNISEVTAEFCKQYDVIIATDLPYHSLELISSRARLVGRPFYAGESIGLFGYAFADLIEHEYIIERDKSNVPTLLKPETLTRSVISTCTKKDGGRIVETVTKKEIYSPLSTASRALLPSDVIASPRRLRKLSPLISCVRGLWQFQTIAGHHVPARADLIQVRLFTALVTENHRELSLPPSSLTSEFIRKFLDNVGTEIPPATAAVGAFLGQDVLNVLSHREQPLQNLMLFDGENTEGAIFPMHPDPIGA